MILKDKNPEHSIMFKPHLIEYLNQPGVVKGLLETIQKIKKADGTTEEVSNSIVREKLARIIGSTPSTFTLGGDTTTLTNLMQIYGDLKNKQSKQDKDKRDGKSSSNGRSSSNGKSSSNGSGNGSGKSV
jgi:hypothetical protein